MINGKVKIVMLITGVLFSGFYQCGPKKKSAPILSSQQIDSLNKRILEHSRYHIECYDTLLGIELKAGGSPNARDTAGVPAIVLAANEAHAVSQVSILLKYGADVNASGKDSMTALHAAASQADTAITMELLKWHANPNIRDTAGATPLMYAVMVGVWGDYSMGMFVVKMLINAGADINAIDKGKMTVLQYACNMKGSYDIGFEEQRLKIVQLLLDKGADVTVRNTHGLTALDMAKILGKSDLIALIREYSKKQSSAGKTKK